MGKTKIRFPVTEILDLSWWISFKTLDITVDIVFKIIRCGKLRTFNKLIGLCVDSRTALWDLSEVSVGNWWYISISCNLSLYSDLAWCSLFFSYSNWCWRSSRSLSLLFYLTVAEIQDICKLVFQIVLFSYITHSSLFLVDKMLQILISKSQFRTKSRSSSVSMHDDTYCNKTVYLNT